MPKISALPAVTIGALTDTFPVVQSGVTKKETLQQAITDVINPNVQLEGTDQVTGLDTALAGKQSTTLTNAHILVGNVSNVAADVAVSADISLVNTGAMTVNSVGGSSASNINSAELLANAATSSNTSSTIVKRDVAGNFSVGYITTSDLSTRMPVLQYAALTPTTVSNTVTETLILGASSIGDRTLFFPRIAAGTTIKINVRGFYSTDTSAPTMRFRIKIASTILDSGAVTVLASSSNDYFELDASLVFPSIGGTGTVIGQSIVTLLNSATNQPVNIPSVNTSNTTIDTTVSNTIAVTLEWGTANSNNTLTTTNAHIILGN